MIRCSHAAMCRSIWLGRANRSAHCAHWRLDTRCLADGHSVHVPFTMRFNPFDMVLRMQATARELRPFDFSFAYLFAAAAAVVACRNKYIIFIVLFICFTMHRNLAWRRQRCVRSYIVRIIAGPISVDRYRCEITICTSNPIETIRFFRFLFSSRTLSIFQINAAEL